MLPASWGRAGAAGCGLSPSAGCRALGRESGAGQRRRGARAAGGPQLGSPGAGAFRSADGFPFASSPVLVQIPGIFGHFLVCFGFLPLVLGLGAVVLTRAEAASASSVAPGRPTGSRCRAKGWALSRSRAAGRPRRRKLGGDRAPEGLDAAVEIVPIPGDRN